MTYRTHRDIYLIRHGQTDWNQQFKAQGWADIPLNEEGLRQADALGRYARSNLRIKRVVSSDLQRCTQTADALQLPYETDQRLREFNTGDLTGLTWEETESKFPDAAADLLASRGWARRPNGESDYDTAARAAEFIHETRLLDDDADIALISHGGLIRRLICVLLDMPLGYAAKLNIENTGITTIRQYFGDRHSGLVLESLNFTGHLVNGLDA